MKNSVAFLFPLLGIFLGGAEILDAGQSPELQLNISPPDISTEFESTPGLSWNAEAGVSYVIQVSTNLANPNAWNDSDVATKSTAGPLNWMSPEAINDRRFYRLVTQPAIYDVQPAFVNSDDADSLLYLSGQSLPSNAIVQINGHNFGMQHDSTGNSGDIWRVNLNGLPPDGPIIGDIVVMDADSNVVATLPVQSPIYYGTTMATEQLQGPPGEPPASPAKKEFKGHVTLMKAFDDGSDDDLADARVISKKGYDHYKELSEMNARGHTKSGHVTLLKAFDDGSDENARYVKTGHVTLMKAFDDGSDSESLKKEFKGHVTLMKAFDDGEDESAARQLPGRNPGSSGQDGVMDFSGETRLQETDFAIRGLAMDFEWTRTYCSRTGPTTSQGAGWDFSYNVSLTQNGDGTITLRPGNGRADTFYPAGTNGWFRDEYFCQIIDLNGDSFPDVLFADTSRWIFNPLGTPASGKLAQIVDRNGNTMSLNYDGKGRLTQIVDDLGRTNSVAYTGENQIASVTDFTGRAVRYEYDGKGDLISVVSPPVVGTPAGDDFPDGITNRYTYTGGNADERLNHNLATCVNGKGQTWLQINYQATSDPTSLDFDRVDSVFTYKNDGVICSTSHLRCYPQTPSPTNNFAVVKAIRHDGAGNVTECFYDSRGRCVRELDYTGRCDPGLPVTENSNRPAGKLRSDGPDYFETKWTWNADSLCTGETLPDGEVTECLYQRAFNQNASRSNHTRLGLIDESLHNGDLRVLRLYAAPGSGGDLDGDGVPDISELSWHFDYDPRFGSPSPTRRIKPGATSFGTATMSWGVAIKVRLGIPEGNGVAINTKGTGADKGRSTGNPGPAVSSSLSENGVVPTRNGYAINTKGAGTNGRMALTSGQPKIMENQKGLMVDFCIAATDPRGIVTTADYDASGNCRSYQRKNGSFTSADFNYRYNSRGQLTAVTNAADANGYRRVDTINYYSSGSQTGWPQSIAIDEGGVHITSSFEYDAVGNLTRCVDPVTNDWLYTYDALDQCVRIQSPPNAASRCSTLLAYDACGNVQDSIEELRDENDSLIHTVTTQFSYDSLDRCVSMAEQVSAGAFLTNCFDYDANGNLIAGYSPLAVSGADPHAIVAYEYDERDLLFREIRAPGSSVAGTNEWSYDVNGRMIFKLGVANGGVERPGSSFSYDGLGRLASVTDPMGNVACYTYDRNGNCTLIRNYGETNDINGSAGNILLAQTQYTYDLLDRCVQTRDVFNNPVTQSPFGKGVAVTTCAYAPNGDCSSITDDNGHTTSYSYDTAGRLSAAVNVERNDRVQWTYDVAGNPTSEIISNQPDGGGAPQMFTRGFSYDSQNRCVATWDNVGNTNRYVYDSFSRCVQTSNPNGAQSWFAYDDLSRCTMAVRDLNRDGVPDLAVDSWQAFSYDDNSRCVSVTDGNTNTTAYAYDSLGNCSSETSADGTVLKLIWSPRSNLLSTEDANGTTITNDYDLCDRIIHRDISARNAMATTTFENFAYDGLSRCVSAANDVSTSTFAYDSLGDCIVSTQDGLTTTYTYDGVGNNLMMNYPGGRVVTYTYNEINDVATMSSSAGGGSPSVLLESYAYAGPARLSGITRANGVNTAFQWDGQLNPANAAGDYGWMRVRGVSHAGSSPVDQRRNSFDRNQNLNLRSMIAPSLASGLETNVFEYDGGDRLLRFAGLDSSDVHLLDWSLDKLGNRIAETNDGSAGMYSMQSTIPPGDFQMNRYSSTPLAALNYDANGNLIANSSASAPMFYDYDYANRLVQVSTMSGGGLSVVASYAYDALGRRVSRTTFASDEPETTQFVYDGEDCDDGNMMSEDGRVIEEGCSALQTIAFMSGAARILCASTGAVRRNMRIAMLPAICSPSPMNPATCSNGIATMLSARRRF